MIDRKSQSSNDTLSLHELTQRGHATWDKASRGHAVPDCGESDGDATNSRAERVFGKGVDYDINVDKDEKLNTRVHITIKTSDNARLRELVASLVSLPQSYSVENNPRKSK